VATWQELQNNTILVVVASILISLTIFAMDFLFGISGEEDATVERINRIYLRNFLRIKTWEK